MPQHLLGHRQRDGGVRDAGVRNQLDQRQVGRMQEVEAAVAKLPQADQPVVDEDLAATQNSSPGADRESVRHEIERLAEPLSSFASELSAQPANTNQSAALPANVDAKTLKEFREIESSLVQVIGDQIELQKGEKQILEKRMTEADRQLQRRA